MKMKAILAGCVLALGLGTMGQAATYFGNGSCSTANVTTSTDCDGQIGGNDKDSYAGGTTNVNDPDGNAVNGMSGIFGITTWSEASRIDNPGTSSGILSMTYSSDDKSGTWSVSSWAGIAQAMLVVKGGNGFIAYLMDLSSTSGTWNTLGLVNNGGRQPEISHLTLYTTKGTNPPPIPLPAAGFLLLGALGGLGLMRRKKA